MQGNLLWPVNERFPKLKESISVDIAIIGGGVTGICSAYYLQKAGYDVIVIEQDEVGSAASGASSGILFYGSGTNFLDAIQLYGKEKSKLLWDESIETMLTIKEMIEKNDIEAGFRNPGAIMVAKTKNEIELLNEEQENLKNIGILAELYNSKEIKNFYLGREFLAGLHFPQCSQIHPAIFSASLAKHLNLQVFENTKFVSLEETNDSIVIKTSNASVKSKKLIFATNLKPLFGLEKYFAEESSVIIASKPLTNEQIRSIWPSEKLLWSMEADYDIIYPADNRLIIELFRLKNMREKISYYYPENFIVDVQWGDSWSKSKDWMPIIGEVNKNIYVAVAMGDQGVVMGFTAARKIAKLIKGEDDKFLEMTSSKRFGQS